MTTRHWFHIALLALGCLLDNAAQAALRIGVSFAIPPYVIADEDRGIEIELLRAALADSPEPLQVLYLPLARSFQMLESGELDGMLNLRPGMVDGVHYSQPVLTFRNMVITSETRWPAGSLQRLTDLRQLKILAFQRAREILGRDFTSAVAAAPYYAETAKQSLQVRQLLRGRIDAVVMERRIFDYYLHDAASSGQYLSHEVNQRFVKHDLFPPTDYCFAFRSQSIRDRFNRNLARLRANGEFARILARYGVSE